MATILCIDDLPDGLAIRKLLLEIKGYKVLTAPNGPTGIKLAEEHDIDVVVLDYRMPGMDGEHVAEVLKGQHPQVPIVLLSGVPELPDHIFPLIDAYVQKGDVTDVLLTAIEEVMNGRRKPRIAEQGAGRSYRSA